MPAPSLFILNEKRFNYKGGVIFGDKNAEKTNRDFYK